MQDKPSIVEAFPIWLLSLALVCFAGMTAALYLYPEQPMETLLFQLNYRVGMAAGILMIMIAVGIWEPKKQRSVQEGPDTAPDKGILIKALIFGAITFMVMWDIQAYAKDVASVDWFLKTQSIIMDIGGGLMLLAGLLLAARRNWVYLKTHRMFTEAGLGMVVPVIGITFAPFLADRAAFYSRILIMTALAVSWTVDPTRLRRTIEQLRTIAAHQFTRRT